MNTKYLPKLTKKLFWMHQCSSIFSVFHCVFNICLFSMINYDIWWQTHFRCGFRRESVKDAISNIQLTRVDNIVHLLHEFIFIANGIVFLICEMSQIKFSKCLCMRHEHSCQSGYHEMYWFKNVYIRNGATAICLNCIHYIMRVICKSITKLLMIIIMMMMLRSKCKM